MPDYKKYRKILEQKGYHLRRIQRNLFQDEKGYLLFYQFNPSGYKSAWFHINDNIVKKYKIRPNTRMAFFFGNRFVILSIELISQWIETAKSYDYETSILYSLHFIEEGAKMIAQFSGVVNYDVSKFTHRA